MLLSRYKKGSRHNNDKVSAPFFYFLLLKLIYLTKFLEFFLRRSG